MQADVDPPPLVCARLQTPAGGSTKSESHARPIRAAASLHLCRMIKKTGKGRKVKEQLVNSVRPLPPIALGSFHPSPKVRLPESQQAAAILNADCTRWRAGFLVKLRPRETQ